MKNACIVGFGAVGPVHARAVAKSDFGKVYAVCDCIRERADKGAKLYNAKPFFDFDEMLCDENIDVVHICTPHYLHKNMAIKALKAGKNIILEKPVSMKLSEIDELEEVYRSSGKKACIMLQNRTNNSIAEMKRIIETDNSLGKMLGIAGFMTWHRDEAYYRTEPWRGRWDTEGGGLLINQAIHMIDLIDWLGGGIKALKSSISNKSNESIEVEDTADALFIMKNGCRGTFYATNAFNADMPFRIEAVFENGVLRYADTRLYRIGEDVKIVTSDAQIAEGKKCWGNGHQRVIDGFYRALCGFDGDYIDLSEGFHSAKVMLSMYKCGISAGKDWINI